MIPTELKFDKDGLLYTNDRKILRKNSLLLDKRYFENERYYQNGFYALDSTNEYIVKYSYTTLTKQEREAYKEMLSNLVNIQNKITSVDFPIGYYRQRKKLMGLIIPYYQNGVSCDNIFSHKDIEELGKYYYHDEDNIHNLFLLLDNVLSLVYEIFENGVYYSDINPGNIILDDNKAKIIDFDPRFVKFDDKDKRLETIMTTYNWFLKEVLKYLDILYYVDEFKSFEGAYGYTKKLENVVRRKTR